MDLHERHAQVSAQLEQATEQAQIWMNRANHLNAVKTELEVWLQESLPSEDDSQATHEASPDVSA